MPSKHNVIGHEWKVAETLFIQVYFDVIGMNRKRDIFPMGLFKNELESLFDIFIQRPTLSYSYFAFAKWRKIIPRKHFPSDVGRSPSLIERAKRERERERSSNSLRHEAGPRYNNRTNFSAVFVARDKSGFN